MNGIHLISIDPQVDFVAMDGNPFDLNPGSLAVPGGMDDMDRLAHLVEDIGHKVDAIHVTMDQHHDIDISHPFWYADDNGDPAPVFSVVTYDDQQGCFLATVSDPSSGTVIETRKLQTRRASLKNKTRSYLQALSAGGRYPHVIWPPHCRIGHVGSNIYPSVFDSLVEWSRKRVNTVNFVAKGSNPFTEHFSAVKAEVPQADDPTTQTNTGLIQTLENAKLILLTGEALSHCVANTARDIVDNFSDAEYVKKIVLISDTTSNVPGFDNLGDQFISDMQKLGMQVMTCADVKSLIL